MKTSRNLLTFLLYSILSMQLSFTQEVYDKLILIDKTSIECKVLKVTESSVEIDPKETIPFQIIERNKVNYIIYSDNTIVNLQNHNVQYNYDNPVNNTTSYIDLIKNGTTKIDQKDFEAALLEFKAAIELNPKEVEGYTGLAIAKWKLNDFSGANEALEKANNLEPYNEKVLHTYAIFFYELKHYKESSAFLSTLIELNTQNAVAYKDRGNSRYFQANEVTGYYDKMTFYNGAFEDLTKAIDIDPNLAEAWYRRGIICYVLGKKRGACIDLNKAIELGYTDAIKIKNEFKCK